MPKHVAGPAADHPWDRQPAESTQAYEAFGAYRDLGRERSTLKVAAQLGKSATIVNRWCSRHGWVVRVAAYDRGLDDRRRAEREGQILRMERRQASHLEAGAQALLAPVQAFLERVAKSRGRGEDPFAGLSMVQLARLSGLSVRHMGGVVEAERLVAGLSTENLAVSGSVAVEAVRRQAEGMDRSEIDAYLLGLEDGQQRQIGAGDDGG